MLTLGALELFRGVNGVRGVASDEINVIYHRVDEATLLYVLGAVNLAKPRQTRAQRGAPISVRTSHPTSHCSFPELCGAQSQQESVPSSSLLFSAVGARGSDWLSEGEIDGRKVPGRADVGGGDELLVVSALSSSSPSRPSSAPGLLCSFLCYSIFFSSDSSSRSLPASPSPPIFTPPLGGAKSIRKRIPSTLLVCLSYFHRPSPLTLVSRNRLSLLSSSYPFNPSTGMSQAQGDIQERIAAARREADSLRERIRAKRESSADTSRQCSHNLSPLSF